MEKYFGVCYYPELYPKEKQEAFIREDIENMRRARFNVVRMAEFCWCLMEPREGVYDFDWLEEIVDRLGQNGIYTVLCTPTACQPVWMARRYPETLYVDNLGVQRSYGGRHYHCYNSPVFRDFTEKICLEMSRRFGRNPYVLGFQVDNEMGQEHSPKQYWLRLRLDKARQLLTDDTLSVADIAFHLGFCDEAHFCKLFRRYTGFTPGQYRRYPV